MLLSRAPAITLGINEDESAPRLVLVHGQSQYHRVFDAPVAHFRSSFQLLLIDLPDPGTSSSMQSLSAPHAIPIEGSKTAKVLSVFISFITSPIITIVLYFQYSDVKMRHPVARVQKSETLVISLLD